MTHTPRSFGLSILLSAVAVLFSVSGTISAAITGSGGGNVTLPAMGASVGGPSQFLVQGDSLHGAAPVIEHMFFAEKITLGILLILAGYALHSAASEKTKTVARRSGGRKSKRVKR